MVEDNLEIVVTPGNWQIPGRPPRWNWQVRQKEPSKFLVKGVTMGAKQDASPYLTSVTIGSTIVLEALVAGPISGASMNPARSLGPALVTGNLDTAWIYILAPLIGALCGVVMFKLINPNMDLPC